MKKGMRSNADGVLEKKRRGQKWKRLAGVLGCVDAARRDAGA